MYQYDEYDQALVSERVAQFRDQIARRLDGELSEEEFLPLRLQNGLYLQKHAYMLRVAIPYGTLSAPQLRALAHVARHYDRGYGHFTTRQNIQFNWIELEQVGDILEHLAGAQMHAIQTSGNCVRNITTEAFAGVAADEWTDPRPLAEILRQWSTVNPEFLFLPRKFKIALSSAVEDRAAVQMHDIGLYLYRHPDAGELRLRVLVGGGLGRTPMLGQVIRDDLPWQHLLSYVEAILRVYNRHGRRDNKYKARIKILVKALGIEAFAREVEEEWQHLRDGPAQLTAEECQRVAERFVLPRYLPPAGGELAYGSARAVDPAFARWASRNVQAPARRRATSPRSRWNASPTGPSATVSARSAWPTNRTWCSPTCAWRTSTRCGARPAQPASARLTRACSATSSLVPAATTARWPTPSRSPSPRASSSASRTSTTCTTSAS